MIASENTLKPIPDSSSRLSVTVVVPTRNRADHAAACVATILKNAGFDELIVVDQSDGPETRQALTSFDDTRLHYVQTDTRGVTSARNIGIELSRSSIVAFTDDDCR